MPCFLFGHMHNPSEPLNDWKNMDALVLPHFLCHFSYTGMEETMDVFYVGIRLNTYTKNIFLGCWNSDFIDEEC